MPGPHVGAELPGDAVIAAVMTGGAPVLLPDLRSSCPLLPGLDGLGAALLVPMVAGSGINGVLVAAAAAGPSPFRSADLQLLQAFANQAELVISYGMAQQALRERELSDDRERIARDLHDHVIQQLFGTGMGLQSAASHAQDIEQRIRIENAVDHLDTTIFDLHQRDPNSAQSVRAQIAALVGEASRTLTFEPVLRLYGPIDTMIDANVCEQLLAALREMLSNVARHAAATAATVSVSVNTDVVVTVADNGTGPPPEVVNGSGLQNLRARAQALNGSFALEASRDHGAVATLRIPLV